MNIKYYEINEQYALFNKQSYSFDGYVENSATEEYKQKVDYAYSLINKVPEEYKEKAYYLADRYAKKLADNMNESFRIGIMCPSMMIAGPAKFPIRKHEKQQRRYKKNFEEYEYIKNILNELDKLEFYKPRVEHKQNISDYNLDNEFFKVIKNEELNRLQLEFNEIPNEDIRNILKKNGFKWSPKNKVWQRQLTNNAIYSTKMIIDKLKDM